MPHIPFHLGAHVGPLPLWGWGAGAAAIATPLMLRRKGKKGKKGKKGEHEEGYGSPYEGGFSGGPMFASGPMGMNPYLGGAGYLPYGGGGGFLGGLYPGFGGLFDRGYGGRGFGGRGGERTGYGDRDNVWGGGGIGMHHGGGSTMRPLGILSGVHGVGSLMRGPMAYSGNAFENSYGLTRLGNYAEASTGYGAGLAGGPSVTGSRYTASGTLENLGATPGSSAAFQGNNSSPGHGR